MALMDGMDRMDRMDRMDKGKHSERKLERHCHSKHNKSNQRGWRSEEEVELQERLRSQIGIREREMTPAGRPYYEKQQAGSLHHNIHSLKRE